MRNPYTATHTLGYPKEDPAIAAWRAVVAQRDKRIAELERELAAARAEIIRLAGAGRSSKLRWPFA